MNDEELKLTVNFDERTTRAVSSAINFTLDKWSGQEPLDQEMLMILKSSFHSMILEFNFSKDLK